MPVTINGTTGLITAGATSSGGSGVAQNTALGGNALVANTSGINSTGIGNGALQSNTTGNNNTAVGYQAGYSNTTTGNMTAIGYQALFNCNPSSTNGNTGVGLQSGYGVTTGRGNTFVGNIAGYSLTTGARNTFIGGADNETNYGSGYFMTSGSANSILGCFNGNQGGLDIRTASNNIVLSDGDGNPRLYYQSSTNTWTTSGNISYGVANQIANVTYNDNNANEVVGIPYYPCLIKITVAGAAYTYVQWYPNSGAGSAWTGSLLNPGNASWAYGSGPSVSFTTAGTNATSFTCNIVGGSGAFRIQRTSGSVAYSVAVYRQALE